MKEIEDQAIKGRSSRLFHPQLQVDPAGSLQSNHAVKPQ